jgi:putative restriction endonuclease
VLARLGSLRQHRQRGRRSPHKPLLVLLALGRLAATGSSDLPWSSAEAALADLIAEFGPPCFDVRLDEVDWPGRPLSQVAGSVGAASFERRPVPRHHERVE